MKRRLRCNITKGMFSDEVTVSVTLADGSPFAAFVPKTEVNEEQKTVSVMYFERGGRNIAVLPDDSRTEVPVASADLQSA